MKKKFAHKCMGESQNLHFPVQFESYQCHNNTTCYSIANIVKSGMALSDAGFKARILRLDVGANVPLVVWVAMWQGVTNKG